MVRKKKKKKKSFPQGRKLINNRKNFAKYKYFVPESRESKCKLE